jgi:NMD protein affecting ribosome stability and mRNA decay
MMAAERGSFKKGKSTEKYHSPDMSRPKKMSNIKNAKLLCQECHAVYDGKSWQAFEKTNTKIMDELRASICPSCHEKIGHISDGVLHLSGTGMVKNKTEIKNLIQNTAKREEERDILNRIDRIEESPNEMTLYTSKNQLAVEIGKKIAAAHKGGKIEIKWSKGDKPVEVHWHFDL